MNSDNDNLIDGCTANTSDNFETNSSTYPKNQQATSKTYVCTSKLPTWHIGPFSLQKYSILKAIRILCYIPLSVALLGVLVACKTGPIYIEKYNEKAYVAFVNTFYVLVITCDFISLLMLKSRVELLEKCATVLTIIVVALEVLTKVYECGIRDQLYELQFGFARNSTTC